MFRQDRTNPSTAVSTWKARKDLAKANPSTYVSAWMNGGLAAADLETWVALASTALGSDTVGVTWTSASSTESWANFQDLVVVAYSQSTTTANGVILQYNNDTTSGNYDEFYIYQAGGAPSAAAGTNAGVYLLWSDKHATQNETYAIGMAQIYDINDTNKYMSTTTRFADDRASGGGYGGLHTGLWKDTSVLTEIDLIDGNGNAFAAGSRYDLYGIMGK